MVRKNQVAAADTPRATAARRMSPASCSSTPSLRNLSQSASSESGNADSNDRTSATNMRLGSKRKPSLSNRHIEDSAGGRSSTLRAPFRARPFCSNEDVIDHAFLFVFASAARAKTLGLHVKHGPVSSAELDQLSVRSQLDDFAVLQHADSVGMAHCGKAVRDENCR